MPRERSSSFASWLLLAAGTLLTTQHVAWVLSGSLRPCPSSLSRGIVWRHAQVDPYEDLMYGGTVPLTYENAQMALNQIKYNVMPHMFGYSEESRRVGVFGEVDLVEVEGPMVVISLKGKFWHPRQNVMDRVTHLLQEKIPEICMVEVLDPAMLIDEGRDADGEFEPGKHPDELAR
eukprot:TRINITY_DN95951_c0_g1_i1.p1 TRINITY_DN95951_c0_g1~~TRINITY_DN95951_c0_g1_i1.p1  ORF type:complete len:176 (+),score=23.68 TRINITY_DN95951_c0_g1_i1:138-665(+)